MNAAITFIHTIIGLLCLYMLWHYGFRPYLLDKFRSELFDLRAELFDHAAEGHVDFNDPSYRALREWLNASIRLAHRFGPVDTMLMSMYGRSVQNRVPRVKEYVEHIESIASGEQGEKLKLFLQRSFAIIGKYAVWRSPLLWVVVSVGFFCAVAYFAIKKVRLTSQDIFTRILVKIGKQAEVQVSLEEKRPLVAA